MFDKLKELVTGRTHLTDKSIKKVAVIFDAGRFRAECRSKRIKITPEKVIDTVASILTQNEELFRTYYYDSPPFGESFNGPISRKPYKSSHNDLDDLKKLFAEIGKKDSIALRRGTIKRNGWLLREHVFKDLINGKGLPSPLLDEHFEPVIVQKGLDMKIGLDIAWLAIKKVVDRIILVSTDADLVPAMKLARVEGVQVVLVPLSGFFHSDMREHSDEVRIIDISKI